MKRHLLALALIAACGKSEPRESPFVAMAKQCPDAELSCPRPIYTVANLKSAFAYYRDQLGFKIEWEHGDPPSFGAVSRANLGLFLCEGCQAPQGAWAMTFTKDVDKLYAELVKRNAIIKMAPTNMPWGMREMQVEDRDGNVLRIGAPLDDHDGK